MLVVPSLGVNFNLPNLLRHSGPIPGYKRGFSPDTRAWNWSRNKEILAEEEVQRACSCVSNAATLVTKDDPKISSAWSRFAACFAFFLTFLSYLWL